MHERKMIDQLQTENQKIRDIFFRLESVWMNLCCRL